MIEGILCNFIQKTLGEFFDLTEFSEDQLRVAILNGEVEIQVLF